MSKKKARIILILLAASLVLLLYTAFIGWGPTGTGAMKNIKLGLDLEGGVSVTYQAKEDNPSAEDMADTGRIEPDQHRDPRRFQRGGDSLPAGETRLSEV